MCVLDGTKYIDTARVSPPAHHYMNTSMPKEYSISLVFLFFFLFFLNIRSFCLNLYFPLSTSLPFLPLILKFLSIREKKKKTSCGLLLVQMMIAVLRRTVSTCTALGIHPACTKCSAFSIFLTLHNNPMPLVLFSSRFYKWGIWGELRGNSSGLIVGRIRI